MEGLKVVISMKEGENRGTNKIKENQRNTAREIAELVFSFIKDVHFCLLASAS